MDGTGPSIDKPGVMPGVSVGDCPMLLNNASIPRLLARPDVALCTECPAELCLPSDLCEYVRSSKGCALILLVDRGIRSIDVRDGCDQ